MRRRAARGIEAGQQAGFLGQHRVAGPPLLGPPGAAGPKPTRTRRRHGEARLLLRADEIDYESVAFRTVPGLSCILRPLFLCFNVACCGHLLWV